MRSRCSANPLTTMIFSRLAPVGRASSDVVAAEVGLGTRRFVTYALAGGLVYGTCCTAIATLAYPLVQRYPVPSTIGAVVLAIVLSSVVDRIDQAVRARRTRT